MNPFRPWEKGEDESIIAINETIYNRFVDVVSNARGISKEKIIDEYGAKIFSSPKAKEIGYIDEVDKSYEEVLEELLKVSNIDINKTYQIVSLTPLRKWYFPFLTYAKNCIKHFIYESFLSSNYKNTLKANNY